MLDRVPAQVRVVRITRVKQACRCCGTLHQAPSPGAGADRWVIVASLVEAANLNGMEPFAWLRVVLTLMTEKHPVHQLDEPFPWSVPLGHP